MYRSGAVLAGRYINQLEIDVGINTRLVLRDGRTDRTPPERRTFLGQAPW